MVAGLLGQVEEIVTANRILAALGILDSFGHVSVRYSDEPDRFLLARSMAPALVSPEDIMMYETSGLPVASEQRRSYLEVFIHSETYRSRPDVGAIVHSHSPAVIPFSIVKSTPLRPVYHMAAFLSETTPVFDIRDRAGEATDLLIRTADLGADLSRCLGRGSAVLMRGHGFTVVGETVQQAVFRSVYLESNAKIQMAALQLGTVQYLTEAEALAAARVNESQIGRAWEVWSRDLGH